MHTDASQISNTPPPAPTSIDVQMNKLPVWAKNYIKIGRTFSCQTKSSPSNHPSTLALCIPKIDFAAAFIALGVTIDASEAFTANYNLEELKTMIGSWVSFQGRRSREIGMLKSVPESNTEMITVTMYKKKLPDLSKLPPEKARAYSPPACKSCEAQLIEKLWHTIQPVVNSDNLELETGSRTRAHRIGSNHDRTKRIQSIFNSNQARWITGTSNIETTLIGNKARLTEEITTPIRFNDSTDKTKLESIIRPVSNPSFKGTEHSSIISNSRLKSTDFDGIYIIEGGPNLHDALRATKDKNRIVLIERCSPSYYNCAATIREGYTERAADFDFSYSNPSNAIVTLGFKHHGVS
ncbi:MAG: hypothetical protein CML13_16725 [Puniceicoccaceae bacterium]|nr:hypothetical protein [Puniceicoccaceae bacterium]|tara:strand:+ start:2778 stop:3833 length:1056 start_codon:yes stop_codon:yes gene_type:complete